MTLVEARKMILGFPKTGKLGDQTVKLMRKQQRLIGRRQKRRLWQITELFRSI